MLIARELPRHPLASWGAVATEAVKHPLKSGIIDMTVGSATIGIGAVEGSPLRIGMGGVLVAYGADEMHEFVKAYRPETKAKAGAHNKLH